ncbi:MAG: lactate utilization protein [Syntrophobacteraceae bacterium]
MGQQDNRLLLKEKAAAVQIVVSEMEALAAAFQYTIDLTKRQGGSNIAAPGIDGKELDELTRLCGKAGLAVLSSNLRDHIGQIATGLTKACWGIAETATLVMDSASEDFRIATMLSETHVALLPASKVVRDAMEIEEELSRMLESSPGYLSFISGASRTADIERVLTIGVHGPRELHLLILEEAKS